MIQKIIAKRFGGFKITSYLCVRNIPCKQITWGKLLESSKKQSRSGEIYRSSSLRKEALFITNRLWRRKEIIKGYVHEHPVHVFVPPTQKTYALANKCDHVVWLEHYRARFVQSMLPDDVTLSNGHVVQRPANWR